MYDRFSLDILLSSVHCIISSIKKASNLDNTVFLKLDHVPPLPRREEVWNRGIKRGRGRERENIPPENWPAYLFQGWSNQALLVEYFIIEKFFF
jgi:hypothetical protein